VTIHQRFHLGYNGIPRRQRRGRPFADQFPSSLWASPPPVRERPSSFCSTLPSIEVNCAVQAELSGPAAAGEHRGTIAWRHRRSAGSLRMLRLLIFVMPPTTVGPSIQFDRPFRQSHPETV